MKLRILLISFIAFIIPIAMQAAAVSPATIDLHGARGADVPSTFTVINTQPTDQTYFVDTITFQAKNESGEPQFGFLKEKSDLTKWMIFPSDRVRVPARSKIDVPFTIHIPSDVASGTYQSAITISSAPAEIVETNGAIVEAKTAILVFLTVDGESNKNVALLDFKMQHKGMQTDLSQQFTFRLQNQGNVYSIPEGSIVLKDLFGRTIRTMNINQAGARVLPMSTRIFQVGTPNTSGWFEILRQQVRTIAIGPVYATLSVNPGEGFHPIETHLLFWYIPAHLILLTIIMIAVVFTGYKRLSKHKKT